jgi:hypothetical protein
MLGGLSVALYLQILDESTLLSCIQPACKLLDLVVLLGRDDPHGLHAGLSLPQLSLAASK